MNEYQHNVIVKLISDGLLRVAPIITFPIMTKYLGTEGYGVYDLANTIVSFMIPFAAMGLGSAIVRYLAGRQDRKTIGKEFSSAALWSLTVSMVMAAGLVLFAPVLNKLFFKTHWATPIIQWTAPLIGLGALEILCIEFFRSQHRVPTLSAFQLAFSLINVCIVAIVLLNGGTLLMLIKIIVIVKSALITVQLLWIRRWAGDIVPNFRLAIPLVRFGLPLIFAGVGLWVINVGDRLVVGYFLGASAVGIYSAVYALALFLVSISSSIQFGLFPKISECWNLRQFNAIAGWMRLSVRYYLLIAMPTFIGLAAMIDILLKTLATVEFLPGSGLFWIIGLGILIEQTIGMSQYILLLNEQTILVTVLNASAAALNLLLNLILVPTVGILGAAISTLLTYIFIDSLLWYRATRILPWKIDLGSLLRVIFASLTMGVVVILVKMPGLGGILKTIVLAMVVYFIMILILKEISLPKIMSTLVLYKK